MAEYIRIRDRVKELDDNDKILFEDVNRIMSEWNPLGIAPVSPDDEYHPYAWEIYQLLKDNGSSAELDEYFFQFGTARIYNQRRKKVFLEEAKEKTKMIIELVKKEA